MQNEILGKVAFAAQYARPTESGRESWLDAVERVCNMHCEKYPSIHEEIKDAFELVKEQRIVPSQRSMQFAGDAIKKHNMRMYNCTYSPVDRKEFFSEMLWLLLCGCGTGFSVRSKDIVKLPRVINADQHSKRDSMIHIVADSIEGWCAAVQALLDSYFFTDYFDHSIDYEIYYDFSKVRPKGSLIASGGIAPGYKPLEVCLNQIRDILNTRLGKKLRSIDVFDICMSLSACVLAGGVRRSASICLFDKEDPLMLKAKTGEWYKTHPNRAYANISATIVTDGSEDVRDVKKVVNLNSQFGEPGVFFSECEDFGTNPCCEIGLYPFWIQSPSGQSVEYVSLEMAKDRTRLEQIGWMWRTGWSVCNLTEVNMQKNPTVEMFWQACKAAAFIGTLQAGYTNTGFLGPVTKHIIENEALIGVSLTGMYANFDVSFSAKVLEHGAKIVVDENKRVAELIGINHASRTTCIKPSGNTSTVLGTCAGIHAFHAERYIRTMRINKTNPVWKEIKEKIPEVTIDLDGETGIIEFACEASNGGWTRKEVNAKDHLDRVAFVQKHWVYPGSKQSRVAGLSHNVSNTCTVKDHEWNMVGDWLWKNRHNVRGVAMLSDYGDFVYQNAPYQTVLDGSTTEARWRILNDVDWSKVDLTSIHGGNDAQYTSGCDGLKCEIKAVEVQQSFGDKLSSST
jgi:ribonucleoside-diphosphate reductase alpha chain